MMYGLIGEHLGHSFSADTHRRFGRYEYELKELSPAAGYAVKDSGTQDFFVSAGTSREVTFENTPLSARPARIAIIVSAITGFGIRKGSRFTGRVLPIFR